MLFIDNEGNILMAEQVDELSPWEISEKGIRVADEAYA